MPSRRAHPPPGLESNEHEMDISSALAGTSFLSDDSDSDADRAHKVPHVRKKAKLNDLNLDPLSIFDGDGIGSDDSGDDDETFIAAQQLAQNKRGGSALKGKKAKGGGFQSMG